MRRRAVVALGVLFAGAVAFYATHKLSPPEVSWAANGQVFVDSGSSAIANSTVVLDNLGERAGVYANMMTSAGVLDYVGKAAGIPADKISVLGPVGTTGLRERRAPSAAGGPYALQLDVTAPQPIIDISATAPTRQSAIALANGAAQGLTQYVSQLVVSQNIPTVRQVSIRQLGPPNANPITSGLSTIYIGPIATFAFVLWCMLVLWTDRFVQAWRAYAAGPNAPKDQDAYVLTLPDEDRRASPRETELAPVAQAPSARDDRRPTTTWLDDDADSDRVADPVGVSDRRPSHGADDLAVSRRTAESDQDKPSVITPDHSYGLEDSTPRSSNGSAGSSNANGYENGLFIGDGHVAATVNGDGNGHVNAPDGGDASDEAGPAPEDQELPDGWRVRVLDGAQTQRGQAQPGVGPSRLWVR